MSDKVVPDNPCADCDHVDCFLNPDWDGSDGAAKKAIEKSIHRLRRNRT